MNTIAIYSDLICPWCYIGKRRLEQALRQLPAGAKFSRSWHPFQLNPGLPREGVNRKPYRTKKFGSWEKSRAMDEQIVATGKSVGIEFRYDLQTHTPNSFDSHRLVWLAGASGVQDAVVEALFRAYFCEGLSFSDSAKLVEIGASAGLDASELKRFFAGDEGAAAVRQEEQEASMLQISGVPFYVINDALTISGAQPPEIFLEALQTARARKPASKISEDAAAACGPEGCELS